VRSALRATILPRIEGEYERSVLIAMLGILGDLRDTVVVDERPVAEEAARLREACDAWIAALERASAVDLAARLRAVVESADASASAPARRARLLEGTETLVRELWSDAALALLRAELLPQVRRAVMPRSS
jgi:hypothetical protein